MSKDDKINKLRAWCSGGAYQIPSEFKVERLKRGYRLTVGYGGGIDLMDIDIDRLADIIEILKIILLDKLIKHQK